MISKSSHSSTTLGSLLRILLLPLLLPGAICAAQQAVAPPHPIEAGQAQSSGVPQGGGSDEGIRMHHATATQPGPSRGEKARNTGGSNALRVSGRWTIDVKNPDGSIAVHRAVENQYDISPFLVYLLAGKVVPGEVMIDFQTNGLDLSAGSPCSTSNVCQLSENPAGLWINESNCTQNPGTCSTNLVPSIGVTTVPVDYGCATTSISVFNCDTYNFTPPSFELNGSIKSSINNNIGHLESWFFACSEVAAAATSPTTSLTPNSCIAAVPGTQGGGYVQPYRMSYLDLGSPIAVSAGQVVSIKLDLSFVALPDQHCNIFDACT